MKYKITAVILSAALVFTVFSACNTKGGTEETTAPGETPTFTSSEDSVTIKQSYDYVSEKTAERENSSSAADIKEFKASLRDNSITSVYLTNEKDINIKTDEKITKPVYISGGKKVRLSSPAEAVIIEAAAGGFYSEERADSLIISGDNITAEIKGTAGSVYIRGRDAVLRIKSEADNIYVLNATAVISNETDKAAVVTLINGTETVIEPEHTYFLSDNRIREGIYKAD